MEKLHKIWNSLDARGKAHVAKKLGVDISTFCRWATGSRKPHFKKMIRIKELFGIDFEDWK